MLPDQEPGLFVYRALAPLAVRTIPSVQDDYRTKLAVEKGGLIAADLRKQSCTEANPHGPFLRLANGEGWVFEHKQEARVMAHIPVSTPESNARTPSGWTSSRTANPPPLSLFPPVNLRRSQCPALTPDGCLPPPLCDLVLPCPSMRLQCLRMEVVHPPQFLPHPLSCTVVAITCPPSGLIIASPRPPPPPPICLSWSCDFVHHLCMQVSTGLWCYRVDNAPVGLALRQHPSHRQDLMIAPERLCPHGMVVWADRKVKSGGTTFVRVQGTTGWLFTSRDGQQTLQPLHPAGLPPSTSSSNIAKEALPITAVRQLAAEHKLQELAHNEASRVISFLTRPAGGDALSFLINVCYTTGTVGTCMEHPRRGKTQLMRRNCTLPQLREIMANPRVHTGKGYYKRRRKDTAEQSLNGRPALDFPQSEEMELRHELAGLDKEMANIEKKRRAVLQRLQVCDAERAAAAAAEVQAYLRGKLTKFRLSDGDYHEELRKMQGLNSARSIALGEGYFVQLSGGGSCYWGVPKQLYNAVNGRQKSLPKPEYVVIGTGDRFYIRFADGSSRWEGEDDDFSEAIHDSDSDVDKVAFGSDGDQNSYWFILFRDGSAEWHPDLPADLVECVLQEDCADVRDVTLGPDGQWFLIWEDMDWASSGLFYSLCDAVNTLQDQGREIRQLLFGCTPRDWLIRYS